MALLRLAGLGVAAMILGTTAGTLTVNGMNSASAYAPPEAGTESAALAQLAAEAAPAAPADETDPACPDCSDRTDYVHVAERMPQAEAHARAIYHASTRKEDDASFREEPIDNYPSDRDGDGSTYESDDDPVV